MGTNYPDVSPGQKIQLSARWHNDINRLLNALNGAGSGILAAGGGMFSRLAVYNSTEEVLQSGWAVSFDADNIIEGAVPAKLYSKDSDIWGVLNETLDPGSFGSVTISGPVEVAITGDSGTSAAPSDDGKTFTLGSSGVSVIAKSDERAIILLGGRGGEASKLVRITSVPDIGYGAGKAKAITAISENGSITLAEEEIPVMIPRLR